MAIETDLKDRTDFLERSLSVLEEVSNSVNLQYNTLLVKISGINAKNALLKKEVSYFKITPILLSYLCKSSTILLSTSLVDFPISGG